MAQSAATPTRSPTTSIIDDTTIPAGASLTPEIKNDFFFVNYRYSFVKNDNVEIAALLGLYGANFRFDVTAVGVPGPARPDLSSATPRRRCRCR